MLIIDEATAERVVGMADAIAAIEQAFVSLEQGRAEAFPVVLGHGSAGDGVFGVKSGLIRDGGLVGLKVGTYWPANRALGLPSHGATTLFLDDATGRPTALVSSTYLTGIRTAAADAVAVRRLARADAEVLGIVGAGHQAWYDLLAICEVRQIRRLQVWNRDLGRAEAFARRARAELGLEAVAASLEATVREADILVTATSASEPLVRREWVRPGTHISAMGADSGGKQELDVALVADGVLYADVARQALAIGEFQTAGRAGLIHEGDVRTLGSALVSDAPRPADAITIFDSSGTGIQDLAIGALAVARCSAAGLGQTVAFG